MVKTWIYDGELEDPFGEFFVTINLDTDLNNLWRSKYVMRTDMIPTIIDKLLARKVRIVALF